MCLENLIKEKSIELGATLCSITTSEKVNESNRLQTWLGKKHHASMKWLQKDPDLRCDPRKIIKHAKSVICLGFSYNEAGLDNHKLKKKTNIARFARGKEYHEYIKTKLKILVELIKQEKPDAKFKICVDTSPILEKTIAKRAGLGWIGKNTLLINPDFGSYILLGEIITDTKLKPDHKQIKDQCGSCRLCIEACPTKALIKPYTLDARKCISYLTIEHKGEIPKELKKYIKANQYGCDICQEVCPYNKT